jgi:hypothetical protein
MRRLIAALSVLVLANLVFARGAWSCPLGMTGHDAVAVVPAAEGGAEDGHPMDHSSHHQSAPAPDHESQAPTCLTMGPCLVTLDLTRVDLATKRVRADRVLVASDHLPPSAAPAPELPPPRA